MSVLYSILVHECPECVEQMCRAIFYFDKDSKIVLHVTNSENIETFHVNHENVKINPQQFLTHWGYDFSRVHVSNFLYSRTVFEFTHVCFLSSNMLPLKSNNTEITSKDVGFSIPHIPSIPAIVNETHPRGFAYYGAMDNPIFIEMMKECGFNDVYNCILDGAFVTKKLMEQLSDIYVRYYNYEAQSNFAFEEVLFPTIFGNLYEGTIYNSLTHGNGRDINVLTHPYNFAKQVNRVITDPVRIKYEELIK